MNYVICVSIHFIRFVLKEFLMIMPDLQTEGQALVKVPLAGVRVWTPGKDYKGDEEAWSGNVYAKKAELNGMTLKAYPQWEEIAHAREIGGFEPSSGLWYQTRARLQTESPDIEKDFITGMLEGTATLWKYLKVEDGKSWADGLFINYPVPNADGTDFERDEKGIPKARQVWQMALPVKDSYVNGMPPELDTFANTLYGMQDSRVQLPDYAFVWVNPSSIKHGVEKRALRSGWGLARRADRRVDVSGYLGPAGRSSLVSFRVFESGEDSIKDADARRRKLIVEARSMKKAIRKRS